MADDKYKKIFAKNIKYYMSKYGKNQMDLMNDLHLSSSTVSNWCTGLKMPRMDKVEILADYFNINKSDLIEEHGPEHNEQRQKSERLLEYYEQLRSDGQNKVLSYTQNLLNLQNAEDAAASAPISFPGARFEVNAAHEDPNASDDDRKAGDTIMTDDSEWE